MVSATDFGRDHWSLLAYVETLCVDGRSGVGQIDLRRMRCNHATHPLLYSCPNFGDGPREFLPKYGTRLSGFYIEQGTDETRRIDAHDDWDCLDDLNDAGFVEILSTINGFVMLTDAGQQMAATLRQHKSSGGNFSNFLPPLPDVAVTS